MPKPLRLLDSIIIVLASRLLAVSYRRLGYAPVATQFALVLACNAIGGVAGCYLISRWTIPDSLTGFLLVCGMANVVWVTSSTSAYKRLWTTSMYEDAAQLALVRFRERLSDRLLTLLTFVICGGWFIVTAVSSQWTGSAIFLGLGCLALSSAVTGYLRAAPPPVPMMPERAKPR